MKYILISFLFFTSAFLYPQQNQKFINVTGTHELIRNADQIKFNVQVKTIDKSVEESKEANDKALNQLLKILDRSGIDSKDIEVSPVRLGKNYEYSPKDGMQVQKGYFVEVIVNFKLKDLTKYYELTNNLASSNSYEVLNSSYEISDYEVQHKAAYENALKAAREKAEYMAKALNVSLGDVLEIEENNFYPYNQNLFSAKAYPNPYNTVTNENGAGEAVSGKVIINRSVRVKFAIK